MKELVLATLNPNKKEEIEKILNLKDVNFLSLVDYPALQPIEEDGRNFKENAIKKALAVADFSQKLSLADDSGLEVEILDGIPGIYSARFAGKEKDDPANIQKLLNLLKDVPWKKRAAKFRCVVALAKPGKLIKTVEGVCKGVISFESKGDFGFGYDPIFFLPTYKKTFSELGPALKNQISHRAKAIGKINCYIAKLLNG